MCYPKFSVVEGDERDVSYTNTRPVTTTVRTVRQAYLPRSSLRSIRSIKNKLSHSSVSDAVYYDPIVGDYVHRSNPHSLHHHHPHHGGGGGDNKTIVVDNGSKKSGGATSVEISDEKSGTTTTVLSANGKKADRALRKSVSWNKAYIKSFSECSSSSSESESDSDSTTSSSSSDSRQSRRSQRGRSRSRSHSRSSSRSRSRSRSSHGRNRSRSRYESFDPAYPHAPYPPPPQHHSQAMMGMPNTMPISMPVSGMNMHMNMNPYVQGIPQQQIATRLITAQQAATPINPVVVQSAPQMLTQDAMYTHSVHPGQYYPSAGGVPIGSHSMRGMGLLSDDDDEDLG
ncbi:hypothetical protein AA313_de0207544 [Arthrobotrys entomopaga]|nr:hypothetical protein AA313_de0207544 [Arthrobotrys entomopaga]